VKHITKHGAQTLTDKITFAGGLEVAAFARHIQIPSVVRGNASVQPTESPKFNQTTP